MFVFNIEDLFWDSSLYNIIVLFITFAITFPLSIFINIVFPKEIRQKYILGRLNYGFKIMLDGHRWYYVFPTFVSVLLISKRMKKNLNVDYDLKSLLPPYLIRLMYINGFFSIIGTISFIIVILLYIIGLITGHM